MKVAVIGSGIAGLSAAWHLDQRGVEVHLIEAGLRVGGYSQTHVLPVQEGSVNVDTGFALFSGQPESGFMQWLDDLGVGTQPSRISLSVRDQVDWLEYGTGDAGAMLANASQLLRPGYWRMWQDLLRFYRDLRTGPIPDLSLSEYLLQRRYSKGFAQSHILPLCAALWAQKAEHIADMSLRHVVQLLRSHQLLQRGGRADWQIISRGSAEYLQAFEAQFGGFVHTNTQVSEISRCGGQIRLMRGGEAEIYDAVVLACHSDEALTALADPSATEQDLLSSIGYHRNDVYLHGDHSFMPRNRACWSSWNVTREDNGNYTATYWMNRLQGLQCNEQFFVTVNPSREPTRIRWQGNFLHPHINQAAYQAQQRWAEISTDKTYYAGAYWGSGLHEDGFASGLRCAQRLLGDASTDAHTNTQASAA